MITWRFTLKVKTKAAAAAHNVCSKRLPTTAGVKGFAKKDKFQISDFSMEVGGWVQVSLGFSFSFEKSSQNSPEPVLIFWSSNNNNNNHLFRTIKIHTCIQCVHRV